MWGRTCLNIWLGRRLNRGGAGRSQHVAEHSAGPLSPALWAGLVDVFGRLLRLLPRECGLAESECVWKRKRPSAAVASPWYVVISQDNTLPMDAAWKTITHLLYKYSIS